MSARHPDSELFLMKITVSIMNVNIKIMTKLTFQGRARMLFKAGFCTLASVAKANPMKMVASVDHLSYKTAYTIISSAKVIISFILKSKLLDRFNFSMYDFNPRSKV